jgi:uncharacterized membrane protein
MATLTAVKFDSAETAEYALSDLVRLHQNQVVEVLDVALVQWPKDHGRPSTRHGISSIGRAKMDGSFWGMLFGLTFFTPLMRASSAAFGDTLAGIGIRGRFVRDARSKIRAGTSALFILSTDAISDEVIHAFGREKPDLIATNLPQAEENRLRELFG